LKDSIGAFEDIKAALNRFSDKPQIYLCRAYFWKDRNDYNKEMLDLLKVTELDSSNYIARENLACAKMLLGMYLSSIADYKICLQNNEKNYSALSGLLHVRIKLKQYSKIITQCHSIIKQDNENPIAHLYMGKAYFYLKKYKDSIIQCSKTLEIDQMEFEALKYRGMSLIQIGEIDEGQQDIDNYEIMTPDF
jgi:tetratricopeptide (TPR) repeat protein